ncbi:MAG TPA: response regulator [Gemmataceae bacterium]|nr:response regulator [Gemmataceae bacterium]
MEDEEDIRTILVRRLQKRAFEVVTAGDGEQACALAQSDRPDLILMDIRLIGSPFDGLEATRRLKGDAATQSIPVIALTADAVGDKPQQSISAGCDDYETKPIDFPRLLEKIREHLQKGARHDGT